MDRFLKCYHGHKFDDCGTECSKDFRSFANKFRNYLKRTLPGDEEIVGHHCGHYDLSGFIRHGAEYIYYSYAWDRFSPVDIYNGHNCRQSVLVRHALDDHDYSGKSGHNEFCSLEELPRYVVRMFTR